MVFEFFRGSSDFPLKYQSFPFQANTSLLFNVSGLHILDGPYQSQVEYKSSMIDVDLPAAGASLQLE
jgi:hypothetical protein